jgi:phage-related protein
MTYILPVTKPLFKVAGEIKTPPFSLEARVTAGALLRAVQDGEKLEMPQSRPMPLIGPGCHELRIPDAIVLLGVLTKKTRATPVAVVQSCNARIHRYDEARKG